jgi:hypothetical protein
MNKNKLRKQLDGLLKTQAKVRVMRKFEDTNYRYGFVIGLSYDWLLLRQYHDFHLDGYVALRIQDISEVRSGRSEQHWEKMLTAEGLLDKTVPEYISLHHITTLIKSLQERGQNIIIRCEELSNTGAEFCIGKVISVEDNHVSFACFDGAGIWEEQPYLIPLCSITLVEFESPYVVLFSKHLKGTIPKND